MGRPRDLVPADSAVRECRDVLRMEAGRVLGRLRDLVPAGSAVQECPVVRRLAANRDLGRLRDLGADLRAAVIPAADN